MTVSQELYQQQKANARYCVINDLQQALSSPPSGQSIFPSQR